jgi:hypothetical protein
MTVPDYISPVVGYRVRQWDATGLRSLNTVAGLGYSFASGSYSKFSCSELTTYSRAAGTNPSRESGGSRVLYEAWYRTTGMIHNFAASVDNH